MDAMVEPSAGTPTMLSGWGRTHRSHCTLIRPQDVDQLIALMRRGNLAGLVPRGAGSSYGDAATHDGGTVLDLSRCDRILDFDEFTGVVTAEAGLTLGQLQAVANVSGWAVPVLPGTPHVSLGGAVAADVHGKNHVGAGSFSAHVEWVVVLAPDGTARRLSRTESSEQFWATVGGMGLTGPIVMVSLQLRTAGSGPAVVEQTRQPSLALVMARLEECAAEQAGQPGLHTVAWIDGSPRSNGRGVVRIVREATAPDRPTGLPRVASARHRRTVHALPGPGVVSGRTIAWANTARWLAPGPNSARTMSPSRALLPLRHADAWPALFGRAGVVQYQLVVPLARSGALTEALELLAHHRLTPALATLKRLGPPSPAPLSFPLEGWTLALDFPARWTNLDAAMAQLDDLVAVNDGRVYLAKDSLTGPQHLPRMYPALERWRAVRDEMDPGNRFCSDLSRRLHLTGGQNTPLTPSGHRRSGCSRPQSRKETS